MTLRIWYAIPPVGLLLGLLAGWFSPSPEDLTILDVGQGDCAVLRHAGVTILIDDGPLKGFQATSQAAITSALRRRGIHDIDLVLLSHPDADHVGGTAALLGEFPNLKIAISASFAQQPKMLREISQWRISPDSILWLPTDSTISLPGCSMRVFCPPIATREDDNKGSMFVHIDDQGATADFSGDAPAEIEDEAASAGGWRADILHVGHHGSRTSTGLSWIKAVHPSVAVISCGRDNPYGHPHRATLDRLRSQGIPVERTDLQGDLIFFPTNGHFSPTR